MARFRSVDYSGDFPLVPDDRCLLNARHIRREYLRRRRTRNYCGFCCRRSEEDSVKLRGRQQQRQRTWPSLFMTLRTAFEGPPFLIQAGEHHPLSFPDIDIMLREEPRARMRQSTLKKEVGSFLCPSLSFKYRKRFPLRLSKNPVRIAFGINQGRNKSGQQIVKMKTESS